MTMSAMREMQLAFLPAALGTIPVVYANIQAMGIMGKVRYADRSKEVHPYRPWADEREDAEPHFRAFKACQNVTEWTVYIVPLIWMFVLYTPAIPVIGRYVAWCAAPLGLAIGYYFIKYIEGYIVSAEGRLQPFYKRARCVRLLFYGALAGIIACAASTAGLF